jgi:hypothetical protein
VISAEGGDFDRRARAWLMTFAPTLSPSAIPLFVVERRLDLNQREGIAAIREDFKRLDISPKLIILDTFSKLSGGLDENDNTEVKQFIGLLDRGFKRLGSTVLLVAHTGHSEKGRPRGASAFGADTDAEYIASRGERFAGVRLTRERFKSSPELEPLHFLPEVVYLGYTDLEDKPVSSLVLRPAERKDARVGKAPMGKPVGANQRLVYEVAVDMLSLGEMPIELVVTRAIERFPPDPLAKRDGRAQTVRRAITGLVSNKVLYMHGANLSLTDAREVQ